jgi:hypothetical protein
MCTSCQSPIRRLDVATLIQPLAVPRPRHIDQRRGCAAGGRRPAAQVGRALSCLTSKPPKTRPVRVPGSTPCGPLRVLEDLALLLSLRPRWLQRSAPHYYYSYYYSYYYYSARAFLLDVVFWPCFWLLLDRRPGRQRLFQHAGVFSEVPTAPVRYPRRPRIMAWR